MEQYRKVEEVLDEITKIPYSVFYDKWVEQMIFDYERFEGFCMWVSMSEAERQMAFEWVSQGYVDNDNRICDYLKSFKS